MQISVSDGSVSFAGGNIDPRLDCTAFLATPLGAKAERWFVNGPFATYRFFPEPGVVATADFRDGRMLNVSLTFDLPDDSPENWSTPHELARKERHDAWLREHLGEPPYRYNWGQVESAFYHQHCGSEITVSYQPGHART